MQNHKTAIKSGDGVGANGILNDDDMDTAMMGRMKYGQIQFARTGRIIKP